jgi:hypothetical protein
MLYGAAHEDCGLRTNFGKLWRSRDFAWSNISRYNGVAAIFEKRGCSFSKEIQLLDAVPRSGPLKVIAYTAGDPAPLPRWLNYQRANERGRLIDFESSSANNFAIGLGDKESIEVISHAESREARLFK